MYVRILIGFVFMHIRTSAFHYFDKHSADKCIWSNPHSNAFLDLDGDCLAGRTL